VRDLEKTFGSLVAARDITVSVPAQQTVGVIGANGAGKTTFIKHDHWAFDAEQRQHPLRGSGHHRQAVARDHAARHFALVPGGTDFSQH